MTKKMGIYCKAYQLKQLRTYSNWNEDATAARLSADEDDAKPRVLEDDDIVYIQEDLSVTDGVFINENVVFQGDGDGWADFCRDHLEFEIPDDVIRASELT